MIANNGRVFFLPGRPFETREFGLRTARRGCVRCKTRRARSAINGNTLNSFCVIQHGDNGRRPNPHVFLELTIASFSIQSTGIPAAPSPSVWILWLIRLAVGNPVIFFLTTITYCEIHTYIYIAYMWLLDKVIYQLYGYWVIINTCRNGWRRVGFM
jgi:hypothetical protein